MYFCIKSSIVECFKPPGGLLYRPGGPGVSHFYEASCMSFRVSSPFSIAITSLGEERANLRVRLFGLCLFRFVGFLFLLGSGKGCGL